MNEEHKEELKQKLLSRSIEFESGCLKWQGSRTTAGYGNLTFKHKSIYAHRASWEVHNGPIPVGMYVLHKCDNPPCINLEHLFIGTCKDNVHDMMRKGRDAMGCDAILTEEQVVEIKILLRGGLYSQYDLGTMFGVSRSAIQQIVLGNNWSHVE